MPISFTYVTSDTGAWGAGTGVQHSASAVDHMFWDIQVFLNDLEDNPPDANGIANIFIDGTQLHIVLDDTTEFILTVPQAPFRPSIVDNTVPADTSGSYELSLSDANKYLRYDDSVELTVIVPSNSEVAFDVDTEVTFRQVGSGAVEFTASTDVTINGVDGYLNQTAGQGATVTLKKVDTDEWDLLGLLAAE